MSVLQTDRARLVDLLLQQATGQNLCETLTRLRAEGKAWRDVADAIEDETGVRISYEMARQWGAACGLPGRIPADDHSGAAA